MGKSPALSLPVWDNRLSGEGGPAWADASFPECGMFVNRVAGEQKIYIVLLRAVCKVFRFIFYIAKEALLA